ncbi:uncharacterized protein LOC143478104 isoform X2 [Brachyhypopomus gauderio]|uniref:uncharacterized protein LOC143478104 isoform X2 n=1 Tax=Brachyhypopomus gauderio TaxID=698409 RepID=UPI0040432487
MKTIRVAGKPHLCLFATRSISPGEEITYNYGDSEWPWRCKAVPGKEPVASARMATLSPDKEPRQNSAEIDAEETTSAPLTMKDQLWTEEHHLQISCEVAQEAIPAKGPVASAAMATLSPDKEPRQRYRRPRQIGALLWDALLCAMTILQQKSKVLGKGQKHCGLNKK